MAGELVLVVDDSSAVQDLVKRILEGEGYRVVSASNGVAALAYPDIAKVNLAIVDAEMDGFDGAETSKFLRAAEETHRLPILLLVPESQQERRASQSLHGANGYLLKPFEPGSLKRKVAALLDERKIEDQSRAYLQEAADRAMKALAEQHVQAAIEKRTQIIVERSVQNVVAMVDQHARREVEARVTALSAEKEQELVRLTVHEVAQSMVEKLAERKVTDAMTQILAEQTERAVKRTAQSVLPGLIRERIREAMDATLMREIQTHVQKAAEGMVPDISAKIVQMVEGVAQQSVPKVARERVPDILERQARVMTEEKIPQLVRELAGHELAEQVRVQLGPTLENMRLGIERRRRVGNWILALLVLALTALNAYFAFLSLFASKGGAP